MKKDNNIIHDISGKESKIFMKLFQRGELRG